MTSSSSLRLLSLCLLSTLSLSTGQSLVGDGRMGNFCGDTGLGFQTSLLDAIQGYGTITYTGENTGNTFSILENQFITSFASDDDANIIVRKAIECVYHVEFDFASSAVQVHTGPPGMIETTDKQVCWTLTLQDETITFVRSAQNGTCPDPEDKTAPTGGAAGTVTNFVKGDIPRRFLPNCNNTGVTERVPEEFLGFSGPFANDGYLWITPTAYGFSENGDGTADPVLSLTCISTAEAKNNAQRLWGLTHSTGCTLFHMKTRVGAVIVKPDTTCGTSVPSGATVYAFNFINLPPGGGELTPPADEKKPVPKVVKKVDVVAYDVAVTPPSNMEAVDFVDPCVATDFRSAIASKLPGSSTDMILLSFVSVNGNRLDLTPDSPANKFTSKPSECSNARRILREARMLPPALTVGVQAVVPPSTTSSNFISTVTNAQPTLPGYSIAAPQNVAPTTVTLAVPKTFPPRKDPYVPDPLIEFFHAIPRFALVGDGVPTNSFSTDLIYFQGALFPAGGIFALAILSLIIYTLAYTCGCCACTCCKCRRKRNPKDYETGCKKWFGTPKAFGVFALINVALILSVIGYLGRFSNGIENVAGAMDDFTKVVQDSSALMSSPSLVQTSAGTTVASIADSCDGAAFAANQADTVCSAANPQCASAVNSILSAANSGATSAGSAARSVGTTLTGLAATLIDTRSEIDVDMIKGMITQAGYGVLGILCFVLTVFSLMVCKNRCASIVFKILVPFNIILVTLVIILAGAFYAVGIIGSDVCVDPAATLLSLTSMVGASGMPLETLNYYLSCGPDPTTPLGGALKLVDDNTVTVGGAVVQIKSLKDQITANPSDPAWSPIANLPWVGNIHGNMTNANDALVTLGTQTLACSAIDPILSKLFSSLCNDGIATIIGIFRILIAASVLLIIQLGIGVDLCCFHPGDPSRWLSDEEAAAQKTVDTSPKPTAVHVGDDKFAGNNPMNTAPKAGPGTTV